VWGFDLLNEYLRKRGLSVNAAKSSYMLATPPHRRPSLVDVNKPLQIHRDTLDEKSNFKFLGISIDHGLTFTEHVQHIHKTSRRRLVQITRSCGLLDKNQRRQVVSALVMPCFDYCDIVWSSCCETELAGIDRVFIDAAEYVAGVRCLQRNDPSSWLRQQLQWSTLNHRRKLHQCIMAWRSRNELQWPCCLKVQQAATPRYHTRLASSGIPIDNQKSSWQQKTPLIAASKVFNRLSHTTRNQPTLERFKTVAARDISRW
jgi:hypothetical protein